MARRRAIHRPDTTSKILVAEAKRLGADYHPLDGAIDCLLFHRNRVHLVDWKSPGATLTDTQAKLVARGWPIRFVSTIEQLQELLT
jgi:ATP-dependent exoDNAse (exonuclease V) beta subunit